MCTNSNTTAGGTTQNSYHIKEKHETMKSIHQAINHNTGNFRPKHWLITLGQWSVNPVYTDPAWSRKRTPAAVNDTNKHGEVTLVYSCPSIDPILWNCIRYIVNLQHFSLQGINM